MNDLQTVALAAQTRITCGVFDDIAYPRIIPNLANIEYTFTLANESYTVREFEASDVEVLDKIAQRIDQKENFQQFWLLKGENPGQQVVTAASRSRAQELRPEAKLAIIAPDDTLVGYLSIDIDPVLDAGGGFVFGDIGYFIDPKQSGKGIATSAIASLIDIGFKEFSFPYINATVDPTNTPSVRILEKLGGKKVGEHYWVEKYQANRQAYVIGPDAFYESFSGNYPF